MGGASEANAAITRAFPCIASASNPRLSYWSVSLADRMGGVMHLGIFLPSPFTHGDQAITDWRLSAACHARWLLVRLRSRRFSWPRRQAATVTY